MSLYELTLLVLGAGTAADLLFRLIDKIEGR